MDGQQWLDEYYSVVPDLLMVFMQTRTMVVVLKKEVHNHPQPVL
jgi:hypothetical protein